MKRIVIDIKTGQVKGNIDVVENDNKSDVYKIYILKNKAIYDLTDKTPRMVMIDKKQNIKQVIDLNVTDTKRGEVSLQVSDAWSREDGKYICQLAIFGLEGFLEQSTYFWITIKNSLFNDIGGEIIADPQFEMLKQELEKLQMALAKIEEWDKYFEDTSGKIEEKYTERLNEINSQLSEINNVVGNEVNLRNFGARPDENMDITNILITAIKEIKKHYSNASYNGKICSLVIPHGTYRITKQIKIPMYIQLKTQGNVLLLTEVPNDSAIWFYADDDPALGGYEDDWFRGKTIGDLIDGSNGGLFLKNNIDSVYYRGDDIGDPKGAIGLEIGTRNETSPWRINSFLTAKNIRIERYHIGLLTNAYHFYICKFSKIMSSFNDVAIQLGDGVGGGSDSGENIVFDFCTFSNSKVGLLIANNGYGCCLNNCSIDYNILAFANEKQTGSDIQCYNCNIEGCISLAYNDMSTTKVIPYKENYYGIYYNASSDGFYQSSIFLRDTKIVPTRGTGYLFNGVNGKTNVYFDGVKLITPIELAKYLHLPEWLFMCTSSVNVESNDIRYVDRNTGPFSTQHNSLIRQSNFDAVEVGKTGNITNGMNIASFQIWEPSNVTTYEIINSTMGKKSMVVNCGETGKIKIQSANKIIVSPNQSLTLFSSFKFTGKMQVGLRLVYLDESGEHIGTSNEFYTTFINSTNDFYSTHEKVKLKVGAGVQYIVPNWIFYNTESTSNKFEITNIMCYYI